MAAAMGVEMLSEVEYEELINKGISDINTANWVEKVDKWKWPENAMQGRRSAGARITVADKTEHFAYLGWRGSLKI